MRLIYERDLQPGDIYVRAFTAGEGFTSPEDARVIVFDQSELEHS